MQTLKKQKWPVLLAALLVLAALAANILYSLLGQRTSAQNSIELGQQYLNEMDYTSAIMEFTNAIELQPSNLDARMGLAQAYTATGDYQFAEQVLSDIQDENRPDPRISEGLLHIYGENGDHHSYAGVLQDLIDQTDDDKYYEEMKQLLEKLYSQPHSYAAGSDQELAYRGGNVVSRGSNTLGQLGTANNLAVRDTPQTEFASAAFPGNAQRVYCAGRTSYVIDDSNNLWAAGENRWGQMGLSYATTLPQSGWTQLTTTGDVVSVAGTVGNLYVLKRDGSLWYAGRQGTQALKRVNGMAYVLKIASYNNAVYVLTSEGRVYGTGYYDGPLQRVSSGVRDFCIGANGSVIYAKRDGGFVPDYNFTMPEGWAWDTDGSYIPDNFVIRSVAANDSVILLLDSNGTLHSLRRDGTITEETLPAELLALYTENGEAVAELADGTVMLWPAGATAPTQL